MNGKLSETLDKTEWEALRARNVKRLCQIYCEAENKITGRKAFSLGNFQLADGSLSSYYFDFRTIYAYPKYLEEVSDMVVKCIELNFM